MSEGYNHKMTHEEYIPGEIDRMVEALGLDESAASMAKQIHQQAIDTDYKHRNADTVAAACLFAAIRLQGLGVPSDEVAEVSREDAGVINTTYRTLTRHLGLSIEPNDATHFIGRYADALDFPDDTKARAAELTERAQEMGLGGQMAPQSLAASVIYLLSLDENLGHTQAEVCEATNIVTKTLRNHYRDVGEALGLNQEVRTEVDRPPAPETVEASIDRLREEFGVSDEVLAKMEAILDRSDKGQLPAGRVAGAYWVALNEGAGATGVSQRELAHRMGVGEATVQDRIREFRKAGDE